MQRQSIGRYVESATGGERVRAFLPAPLPPNPPIELDGTQLQLLEAATLAVGRLDATMSIMPDAALFLRHYVRKEAILSSQIEDIPASLSDLLVFELNRSPHLGSEDVVEVSNCVSAMEYAQCILQGDFPLSNRLLREVHFTLMSTGPGKTKLLGEFRRSQNWIGGTRPGNAVFVPPPHIHVQDCMSDLERFLHANDDGIPNLVRAGLAHLQFETIHPFLDGNGRVGRILITLLLLERSVLKHPSLYLSLYFKQHRNQYYNLLNYVRQTGDWEAWLDFYLEGVRLTANDAVTVVHSLTKTFGDDQAKIERHAGRRAGSVLRVHSALKERPILSIRATSIRTGLSFRATAQALHWLVNRGIVHEITGKNRNRLFSYHEVLKVLLKGTEPS